MVDESELAGRVPRFFAKSIDGLLQSFVVMIFMMWMFGPVVRNFSQNAGLAGYEQNMAQMFTVISHMMTINMMLQLAVFAGQAIPITLYGQSIGKMCMRIRIVNQHDGKNGGFIPNVLLRAIVPGGLSLLTFGLFGFIDALFIFHEDCRCLHDKMAGTVVVKGGVPMQKRRTVEEIYLAAQRST